MASAVVTADGHQLHSAHTERRTRDLAKAQRYLRPQLEHVPNSSPDVAVHDSESRRCLRSSNESMTQLALSDNSDKTQSKSDKTQGSRVGVLRPRNKLREFQSRD